jgi:hypothetical protein
LGIIEESVRAKFRKNKYKTRKKTGKNRKKILTFAKIAVMVLITKAYSNKLLKK